MKNRTIKFFISNKNVKMKKPFEETAKVLIIPHQMVGRFLARFPTLALSRSGVRVLSQSSHLAWNNTPNGLK
jgi:hypothetical protein